MCTACDKLDTKMASGRRKRLWDLNSGWHCSILGTCLTLSDLRALGRKLSLHTRAGEPQDYQFHGYFVKEACEPKRPAKLLNKLLDKRHTGAIRKAKDARSIKDLEALWSDARASGSVPGLYWAILTHPMDAGALCERMFADVHMLSHLVGASNRADVRRLSALENQVASLDEKLGKQHQRNYLRLEEKNREIAQLKNSLRAQPYSKTKVADDVRFDRLQPALQQHLTSEMAQRDAEISRLYAAVAEKGVEVERLQQQNVALREENQSFESIIHGECTASKTKCDFDLDGRCLLYVGGRQHTVHHLRALVEKWNGQLLHHDGGIERSIAGLAREVSKADAVMFPTDCVSHSAALKVKQLCHQTMKPFVPLRSSGITSFVAVLRNGLYTT